MRTITIAEAIRIVANPDHPDYDAVADAYEDRLFLAFPKVLEFLATMQRDLEGYPPNTDTYLRYKQVVALLEEINEIEIP